MTVLEKRKYSIEEYLLLGERSGEKFEFLDGRVRDISGANSNHSTVAVNLLTLFNIAFSEKNLCVLGSDQMIGIPTVNQILHSDLLIVEGENIMDKNFSIILNNPKMVIEIISNTPKGKGKYEKLHLYREIPSLREYVVIHAEKCFIQSYFKEESGLWKISSASSLEDKIHLHSIQMELSLKDIYRKIKGLQEGI